MLSLSCSSADCIVIAHGWLSLARGDMPLVYLPFGVLTHPLSLRGAGAFSNVFGELLHDK